MKLIHAGIVNQARNGLIEVAVFFPQLGYQPDDFTRVFIEIAHLTSIVQLWRRMRG